MRGAVPPHLPACTLYLSKNKEKKKEREIKYCYFKQLSFRCLLLLLLPVCFLVATILSIAERDVLKFLTIFVELFPLSVFVV